MRLILREGRYDNETVLAEEATCKLISDSMTFIEGNGDITTLELVSENGSITAGFEPSLNKYFIILTKKLFKNFEGFNVEPQIENLKEIEMLFNYYLANDSRLEKDFKWVKIVNEYDENLNQELHQIKLDYIVSIAEIYPKNSEDFLNLIRESSSMTYEEFSIATDKLVQNVSNSYQFDDVSPTDFAQSINFNDRKNEEIMTNNPHPLSLPEHHIDGGSAFGIDRKNKLIIFGQLVGDDFDIEALPYENIQSTEVLVDADSYLKTDRAGQIGGALIGGALTGGIGALVMAMGAKKKNVEKIRSIELKIIVKGSPNPVKIYKFSDGIFSSSRKMVDEATKWNDMLRALMAEASVSVQQPIYVSNQGSLADEIQKLLELKNQGILTESEFSSAKQKLLS